MSDATVEQDYEPIPVSVITGFLGSGKTTLLNHLLQHPDMGETAVLINEFGEIGLDHMLVRELDEDVILLNSGCLCCTVREDLVVTMRDLLRKRMEGDVPPFRRLVIETTGLADPAPILHTLMTDLVLESRYRVDGIVTTVDAVHASGQLDRHNESLKQAAVADRIVLTKTDIGEEDKIEVLMDRLKAINPGAQVIRAINGEAEPEALFNAGLYDPDTKTADVRRWLNDEAYADAHGEKHDHEHDHGHDDDHDHAHADHDHEAHDHEHESHDVNRHDDSIRAFCMTMDDPLPWGPFVQWIESLVATQGENLLRIKGILNVDGEDKPVAVHGVQHVFHPPTQLPRWPDDDRRSRIVFIVKDLNPVAIEKTYQAFVANADPTDWDPIR